MVKEDVKSKVAEMIVTITQLKKKINNDNSGEFVLLFPFSQGFNIKFI